MIVVVEVDAATIVVDVADLVVVEVSNVVVVVLAAVVVFVKGPMLWNYFSTILSVVPDVTVFCRKSLMHSCSNRYEESTLMVPIVLFCCCNVIVIEMCRHCDKVVIAKLLKLLTLCYVVVLLIICCQCWGIVVSNAVVVDYMLCLCCGIFEPNSVVFNYMLYYVVVFEELLYLMLL